MTTSLDLPGLDALPVVLAAAGPSAARIRRLVEGELGWQPVDDGTAAVLLADVPGAAVARPDGRPSLLLVAADDDPREAAEAVRRLRPTEVLTWPPPTRDHLRDAVAAALRGEPPTAGSPGQASLLTVGGASGGVGTTTVALALAGLLAWDGRDVVAVVGGAVPHPTRGAVASAALTSPTLEAALQPARGVPRLRLLRVDGERPAAPVLGAPTVVDRAVDVAADVLVCRRDLAALEALAVTPAGAVVVTDSGAVPWSVVRRAAAGRRLVVLPWSARVARAAAAGRVPASLPGSWLGRLRPLVGGGSGRG